MSLYTAGNILELLAFIWMTYSAYSYWKNYNVLLWQFSELVAHMYVMQEENKEFRKRLNYPPADPNKVPFIVRKVSKENVYGNK